MELFVKGWSFALEWSERTSLRYKGVVEVEVGWIGLDSATFGLLTTETVGTWHMIWPGTPTTVFSLG